MATQTTKQEESPFSEAAVASVSQHLGEPAWLREDRLAALKRFDALPLESNPLFTRHTEQPKGLEGYEPYLGKDAGLTLTGPQVPGARFQELTAALKEDAEALRGVVTRDLAGFHADKYTNLPRALFGTGALLHLPRDAAPEEPFTIRYAPTRDGGAVFARNVLVLEPGARATVVEEVEGAEEAGGLLSLATEVVLGAGAELRLLGVEHSLPRHVTLATRQAHLAADARLDAAHAYLGSRLVKGRSDVVLAGSGARVHQSEVVFGSEEQRFDLTSYITHAAPATVSDAHSKAVMRDRSRANVKGVIHIAQEGRDSDSYLAQHAMLMSKKARCIAVPSLEIINREIRRAKHAATVAQVAEDQVFYLQSRGLSTEEARKAIVMGFLAPLLDRLGEPASEAVRAKIEAKWGAAPGGS